MTDISTKNIEKLIGSATAWPWRIDTDIYEEPIVGFDGERVLEGWDAGLMYDKEEDRELAVLAPMLAQEVLRLRKIVGE